MLQGDCRQVLTELEDESVHCVVTSPPYFGLRDYGTAKWEGGDPTCDHFNGRPGSWRADGIVENVSQRNRDGAGAYSGDCRKCGAIRTDSQIGLERSPDEYVASMVGAFREVRRVLRKDGTLWLNLGDSYGGAAGNTRGEGAGGGQTRGEMIFVDAIGRNKGGRSKDLIGIPWRVAFALQADGWYLRQDIIWSKPNPMPESVTDRCTKAHEYIFLLSKCARYFYDQEAIAEDAAISTVERAERGYAVGGNNAPDRNDAGPITRKFCADRRNKRSVWEVATQPFSEAHFATFPPALIEPCILAGCPQGGTVLDPFGGAGTTGLVADRLGRNAILIELNPDYAAMANRRIKDDAGMFAQIVESP
jgi:DNA modification methylase